MFKGRTAKDAEEGLKRFYVLIKDMEKLLEEQQAKKPKSKVSEILGERKLMIAEMKCIYESCVAMVEENAKLMSDIIGFVELVKSKILNSKGEWKKEMFTEQVSLLNGGFEELNATYEHINVNYINIETK